MATLIVVVVGDVGVVVALIRVFPAAVAFIAHTRKKCKRKFPFLVPLLATAINIIIIKKCSQRRSRN